MFGAEEHAVDPLVAVGVDEGEVDLVRFASGDHLEQAPLVLLDTAHPGRAALGWQLAEHLAHARVHARVEALVDVRRPTLQVVLQDDVGDVLGQRAEPLLALGALVAGAHEIGDVAADDERAVISPTASRSAWTSTLCVRRVPAGSTKASST